MADDEQTSPRDARDDSDRIAAADDRAYLTEPHAAEEADVNDNEQQEHTEENQYGLQDLEMLPLLEQVHRLFHAIQMKYPYKEVRHSTNAFRV